MATPKNGEYFIALLAGGTPEYFVELQGRLRRFGIYLRDHWQHEQRRRTFVHADVDFGIFLEDEGYGVTSSLITGLSKVGAVLVETPHKASVMRGHLEHFGLLRERSVPEAIVFNAPPPPVAAPADREAEELERRAREHHDAHTDVRKRLALDPGRVRVRDSIEKTPPIAAEPPAFADRLAKLCDARGLSKEELGVALGVSRSTVFRWASGERLPSQAQLEAFEALEAAPPTDHDLGAAPPPVPEPPAPPRPQLLAKSAPSDPLHKEQVAVKTSRVTKGASAPKPPAAMGATAPKPPAEMGAAAPKPPANGTSAGATIPLGGLSEVLATMLRGLPDAALIAAVAPAWLAARVRLEADEALVAAAVPWCQAQVGAVLGQLGKAPQAPRRAGAARSSKPVDEEKTEEPSADTATARRRAPEGVNAATVLKVLTQLVGKGGAVRTGDVIRASQLGEAVVHAALLKLRGEGRAYQKGHARYSFWGLSQADADKAHAAALGR